MLHFPRLAAAALVALALAPALDAEPASASTTRGAVATPANVTSHPWSTDGCSNAPDTGPVWDFRHPCVHHDGCYRGHWASRRTCDDWFHRDLRATCRVLHHSAWGRWPCYGVAASFYAAVRAFGGSAYSRHSVTAPVR